MKPRVLLVPLLLALTPHLRAEPEPAPLRRGDDTARILEVLGEPNGYIESGTRGVYVYDRGKIHTRNGKVDIINLISEEELDARRTAARIERLRRLAEGEALLADLRESDLLDSMSGREQVAFWDRFLREYPDVELGLLYTEAKVRAEREQAEEDQAARLAALELRVRRAEQEAAEARAQAAQARQTAENRSRYGYGVVIPSGYYSSYIRHRPRPDVCDTGVPPGVTPRRYHIARQIQTITGLGTTTLSWKYR